MNAMYKVLVNNCWAIKLEMRFLVMENDYCGIREFWGLLYSLSFYKFGVPVFSPSEYFFLIVMMKIWMKMIL